MDYPKSVNEARRHIAEIRNAKGLDGPATNTTDLENALIILSEQLYQKSTHFLLELIQNADDNSYNASTPTLNITVTNQTLRIDCNEIGFSKKNTEAICKIGRSTKTGLDKSTRYIGEKGIGFKSVFKVADIVWIVSGHYSFKFDKHAKLGIIAPIWEAFPQPRLAGYTSMYMQLAQGYDTSELLSDLKSLDTRMLIFLRKLRQVNLTVHEKTGKIWGSTLGRHDIQATNKGEQMIRLQHNADSSSYRIVRQAVSGLPSDPKRLGSSESEILLAFPYKEDSQPLISTQNVYAFLPIRDYGFKFLIQADFLLIASREDIDSSSQWNYALLREIPRAFRQAVDEFNSGDLRYTWIRYLAKRPMLSDFFANLESTVIQSLKDALILESLGGTLTAPTNLRHLPVAYCDDDGLPLVRSAATKLKYISSKYSLEKDKEELIRLGVREIKPPEFIVDLKLFIEGAPHEFRSKPSSWHACLCKALFRLINDYPVIKHDILQLEIIPLKDGRWVAPSRRKLCFPDKEKTAYVPKGISVMEIDLNATKDMARRNLFVLLGAQTFSNDMVCEAIVTTHAQRYFQPNQLSRQDLISHVAFLYHANWKNHNNSYLWVSTESGPAKRGDETYVDSEHLYSASTTFKDSREKFSFITQEYFQDIFAEDEHLRQWLVENLHVAEFPRLVSSLSKKITLHGDFKFISDTRDYLFILMLLKDQWRFYQKWIVASGDESTEKAKSKLREHFANMTVHCKGGGTARLKETMLPLDNMVVENMAALTFIDIPNPEDHHWRFLGFFGTVVNAGVGSFIQCLQLLKESGGTLEQTSELYKQIFLHSSGQEEVIQNSFASEFLIFAPRSRGRSKHDWISPGNCVWEGPTCLRKTPCMRDFYPEHARFFCITLRLGKANWRTLMDEAQSIEAYDNIDYISDVFISISNYLKEADTAAVMESKQSMITALTESAIYPIDTKKSQATFDYLSTAQSNDAWFIADRWHLGQTFEGLVPLLALKFEAIDKIQPLIKALGLDDRLLSGLVTGVPQTGGRIQLDFEYTKSICAKARYIARLIPEDLTNRLIIIEQLCNSKVYTAEKVTIQWTLKMLGNGLEIVSRADSGRVKVAAAGKTLQIFLRKDDADVNRPPFELREELTTFCGLQDAARISLLHWVISEPSITEIETVFRRRGLHNDVPELEALTQSIDRRQNSQFWNAQPPGCDETHRHRRHYQGKSSKKPQRGQRQDGPSNALDAVQSFMSKYNQATSWRDIATQQWKEVGAEAMLAHLCRLENMNPFDLLPQNDESAWTGRLRKGGAFPDDVVGVFFDEDRLMHKKSRFIRPDHNFPAAVKITKDRGVIISVHPLPSAEVGGEIILSGETYISELFKKEMGSAFQPQVHWTSHFRQRYGLDPFEGDEEFHSTFTIKDDAGSAAFTKFLHKHGYKKTGSWCKHPSYHIEVSTTDGDILSSFTLEPFQVHKAWLCHQNMNNGAKDIFVLIRISGVRDDPKVALFVDPWQMHADGKLLLAAESRYVADFEKTPDFIPIASLGSASCNGEDNGTKRRTKFFSRHKSSSSIQSSRQPADGSHVYKALKINEIRILELFPGEDNAPLEGTVRHVAVEEAAGYIAISYVWGSALTTFHLETKQGRIPLTTSLYFALKRLRSADEPLYIWADAICINQSDDYEKSMQIRKLPTIFQSAEQVLAWIGDEEDNSHEALQTLMQIGTNAVAPDEWPEELPPIPCGWDDGVPPIQSKIWYDIAALFERDWFKRVWIIQEVVLAADVRFVCGAWDIDWNDIFSVVEICVEWSLTVESSETRVRESLSALKPAYALGLTRKAFKEMNLSPQFNLLALLDHFAHAQSTKERDKLFALLGISSDAGADAFDPDYQSSIESIVRRYAAEFVRRGSAIDILYRAGLSKSYTFSSWIPKWTSQEPSRTISTWRGANGIFCAGPTDSTIAQILKSQTDKLQVKGIRVDRIVRVGQMTIADHDVISVINSIHILIDELKDYPTGETKGELKLTVPIGNAITPCEDDIGVFQSNPDADGDGEGLFDWNDAAFDVDSMQDMVEFLKQNRDARILSWKYWYTAAAFLKRLSNGRFCVTDRGYVGFAPFEAKMGDMICVLNGGAVPFVLRQAEDTAHKLVGECYIHGIMYGESLEFSGTQAQDFILM